MKILVGIKHVPDTETKIKVAADGVSIDESGVKWIISPYDEYALEEALRLRERNEGEVVVVCAGGGGAQSAIRQGLAMGADRAVHVRDGRFDQVDALTRAKALAAVAGQEQPDLILFGKYGVGTDEGQTGAMVAELLGWPHVSAVAKVEWESEGFVAERGVEGAVEIHEGSLPAVLTCEKGLNEPRYASLKGIMQAKKKKTDVKSPEELGIDDAEMSQPRLVWEALELPPPRTAARLIEGSPEEAARELVRLLREDAKVI